MGQDVLPAKRPPYTSHHTKSKLQKENGQTERSKDNHSKLQWNGEKKTEKQKYKSSERLIGRGRNEDGEKNRKTDEKNCKINEKDENRWKMNEKQIERKNEIVKSVRCVMTK